MTENPKTIHVAIGNSDNKLTQREWAGYWYDANACVEAAAIEIYGVWASSPTSQYQNAAWSFKPLNDDYRQRLRDRLADLAEQYEQDSIAWNESVTELITAP